MSTYLDIDFQGSSEDRKLYAADSLNNLNKLKLCANDRQDIDEANEDTSTDVHVPTSWTNRRNQSRFLTLLIMTVIITLVLSFCVILLLVKVSSMTHEVTQRLEKGEKYIAKIRQLLLTYTNHTNV
ncbi:leucine-rich single-pass membrane protein 1 [Discoglossus pictus]